MTDRIGLRCRCGTVRGTVERVGRVGQRLVCYCDDCQAYAHFLERSDVLDAHGGTDLYQTRPALVTITEGASELACVRLSADGMLRWYARCCRTPIGNTLASSRAPFVGLIDAVMDHAADGRSRDEALGPPIAKVQGRFAIGGVPAGAEPTASLGTIARTIAMVARSVLAGGHAPSPFVDPATKKPRVEPRVLTKDERDALR